eukprot:88808_1
MTQTVCWRCNHQLCNCWIYRKRTRCGWHGTECNWIYVSSNNQILSRNEWNKLCLEDLKYIQNLEKKEYEMLFGEGCNRLGMHYKRRGYWQEHEFSNIQLNTQLLNNKPIDSRSATEINGDIELLISSWMHHKQITDVILRLIVCYYYIPDPRYEFWISMTDTNVNAFAIELYYRHLEGGGTGIGYVGTETEETITICLNGKYKHKTTSYYYTNKDVEINIGVWNVWTLCNELVLELNGYNDKNVQQKQLKKNNK